MCLWTMDKTNLFYHSPKELVTDGFLMWLFYLLDSDDTRYGMLKQKFFDSLVLKKSDCKKEVSSISVERQIAAGKGRMDILLGFVFTSDKTSKRHYVLFEDKVSSTTCENQLSKYKDYCDSHYNKNGLEMYDYFYLKLDYIDDRERDIAVKTGYRVVSNEDLVTALTTIKGCHVIVDHYLEYIKDCFFTDKKFIQEEVDNCFDGKVFEYSSVQKYYMGQVLAILKDNGLSASMKIGSSFGLPWVELWLSEQDIAQYEGKKEALFWRIDRRSNVWHLRLSQYCKYGDKFWNEKKIRLKKLRSAANNILKGNHPELKPSTLSNRGKKGSDVIVLTFTDNTPKITLNNISALTSSIREIFNNLQ